MVMEKVLEKDVTTTICNYSGYVIEKGIEKRIKIGISQGEARIKPLMQRLIADIGLDAAYDVLMDPEQMNEYCKKYGID